MVNCADESDICRLKRSRSAPSQTGGTPSVSHRSEVGLSLRGNREQNRGVEMTFAGIFEAAHGTDDLTHEPNRMELALLDRAFPLSVLSVRSHGRQGQSCRAPSSFNLLRTAARLPSRGTLLFSLHSGCHCLPAQRRVRRQCMDDCTHSREFVAAQCLDRVAPCQRLLLRQSFRLAQAEVKERRTSTLLFRTGEPFCQLGQQFRA